MSAPAAPTPGPSRRNSPLWAALLATLLCTAALLAHKTGKLPIAGLEAVELDLLDARFRLRGTQEPADGQIVIVGFDDALRRLDPEVFQQRRGWVRLLDALAKYKPRAVAIDAFFAEPEALLPPDAASEVTAALAGLRAEPHPLAAPVARAEAALAQVQTLTEGDLQLAQALGRASNIVMSVLFFLDEGEAKPAPPQTPEPAGLKRARVADAAVLERPQGLRPLRAELGVYASLPAFAEQAAGAGYVNVLRDESSQVRRVPLVLQWADRYYQPLGLSLAARARPGLSASYVAGADHLDFGERSLPVDTAGVALIGWLGPAGTFPVISGADVLLGRADPAQLADKLVLLGYTDAARDRIATPFDPACPGVELHATLAHNALHGGLLRRPPAWHTGLCALLLGGLLAVLQRRSWRQRRPWLPGVAGVGLTLLWGLVAQLLFGSGLVVDVAGPVAAVLIVTLAAITVGLATEGRERAQLRRAFAHYVSGGLVDRIVADPARVRLGGERRQLSVLFSDIRGFSSFSERMEPEALSAFLNEYLTPMTQIVLDEGGMLDKYIGDAVMAVFGAPLEQADHAHAACRTALAMQARLEALRPGWAARGLPAVAAGVGINAGDMSVGNMGSEIRFDYTVMGDAVNLASRLEGLTKEYSCTILCGPQMVQLAAEAFVFREVDTVRVKGRGGAVPVFELMGERSATQPEDPALDLYARALALYRQRDFAAAGGLWQQVLDRHPDDGPARVLQARARELAAHPPGEDWDGVYDQQHK